ncbi:P-loop containing nucleoside triphosphate hydrolase protein [Kockiozyma suomiensis]|uniref:P-loop containing nucleoside triphosphate hydrolase protein n=1 Tax=Kockiozyma suomiensis TaxID=1337062 RepID=UPI0033431CE4
MADIFSVLPDYSSDDYDLLNTFSECNLLAADLASLSSSVDALARRTRRSQVELRSFFNSYEEELKKGAIENGPVGISTCMNLLQRSHEKPVLRFFSTGDSRLDMSLFGGKGIATGCITEIVGESSVGKSTFLTQLCVSVQLSPENGGLNGDAIYISTESGLSTHRLNMLISSFRARFLDDRERLSADRVHYVGCRDLEEQDHILQFQLPAFARTRNIGLIVLDSIASHYRAEHFGSGPSAMYVRGNELLKTASVLRRLAKECKCAVVVANQVTDLFRLEELVQGAVSSASVMTLTQQSQMSQATEKYLRAPSDMPASSLQQSESIDFSRSFEEEEAELLASMNEEEQEADFDVLEMDLQSRFYTGWNWLSDASSEADYVPGSQGKTSAMGHVWSLCVSQRIVFKRETIEMDYDLGRGKRTIGVVFSPYFESGKMVEFEIDNEGVREVPQ